MGEGEKVIASNRKARHDYHVVESYEAGIELQGTEVKSLRAGGLTLKDSFAEVRDGQMYLVGAHIQPYEQGNRYNHKPERDRRLLMHKSEILKLHQRVAEKGLTLVPLKVYFTKGLVKVEVGLCRGKKSHDKRDTIQERETKREIDRAMKEYRRG